MTLTVRTATLDDLPCMLRLMQASAAESGWSARYNPDHARAHMTRLLSEGLSFALLADDVIIGAIVCMPIDVGFTTLNDLETVYIFVEEANRSYAAIVTLFKAAQTYAKQANVRILFHQLDYLAAVDGRTSNGARVETLFKRARFHGPVGTVYAAPDFVRVGITYLCGEADGDPAGHPQDLDPSAKRAA